MLLKGKPTAWYAGMASDGGCLGFRGFGFRGKRKGTYENTNDCRMFTTAKGIAFLTIQNSVQNPTTKARQASYETPVLSRMIVMRDCGIPLMPNSCMTFIHKNTRIPKV